MFFVVLQGKNEDIQLKSTVKTEMKGTDLELKGKIYFYCFFLGSTFEMIWQVRAKG